jgi:D-alanyl-D-alanine carboxypeptidase
VEAEQAADTIRRYFEQESLGAVVVGVWQGDEPVVVGALGESMPGVPATTEMHHRTGNISAPFMTTVFLQLVDEGVLALDDTVSEWYPDLPAADQITLEMLAHSTSGYAHFPSSEAFVSAFYADPYQQWDPEQLVRYGTDQGVAFTPGTSWRFADTNLVLLSNIIERATGEDVWDHIERRIVGPLGLGSTTGPHDAALPEPVLHGFTGERGVWEDATFWNPQWITYAGGLGSDQDDLRRWVQALGTGELLPAELHELQLGPATVGLGTNTASRYYAMGTGMTNGWLYANPSLQGYAAAIAYLHEGEGVTEPLTIVIYNTLTQAADPEGRVAGRIFQELGTQLAPQQAPMLYQ